MSTRLSELYSPLEIPDSGAEPFTDYSRWRLRVSDDGRHTWHYVSEEETKSWPQNEIDKYWTSQPLNLPSLPKAKTPLEAAKNGFTFYSHLQAHDGHWPGEYGGPMFLLPGLVIGSYVSGMGFTKEERLEMIRYLLNRAHPEDGGWGIHTEGHSTVFGTALNYVSMRILGVHAEHPALVKARATLHRLGGATGVPSWGKFWLSVLGVYDWEGNNPVPPELWLFPAALPIHPHRWWIHTRTVYCPISFLYGIRFSMSPDGEGGELISQLRQELYTAPYESINWPAQRNNVCAADLYSPHSKVMDGLNKMLGMYESLIPSLPSLANPLPSLRLKALQRAYDLIVYEDANTSFQTLGPVSKMMNLIARAWVEGRGRSIGKAMIGSDARYDGILSRLSRPDVIKMRISYEGRLNGNERMKEVLEMDPYHMHDIRRADFMWLGKEGMMMCGTNGSQLWDVGFITQALVETGLAGTGHLPSSASSDPLAPAVVISLTQALHWLDKCQIKTDPLFYKESFRHRTKGAWPFSTREQGYTVSDCTGEGLKAVVYLQEVVRLPKVISNDRLYNAVDTMLSLQNANGGFASYELVRGPSWLELLNVAEVFGDIMTEYCYPECTTSVITALAVFRKHFPDYRAVAIDRTIRRAINYIHSAQKPCGGWVGSWGICFTYATQFALEALSLVGETYATSSYARRACEFLIEKQRADGGWGESYKSCETSQWVEHTNTQVVQTCWATMALMYAEYPHAEPIERAVKLVMDRQLPDGSWAQEALEGIFNKNCAIAYPNFKFSFTIWMLGQADRYLSKLREKA